MEGSLWRGEWKHTPVLLPREVHGQRSLCVCVWQSLSHVQLFATTWTVAHQAPLSMGFSRQECCSVLPFPSPGDHPEPGIEPGSSALQADSLLSEPSGKPPTSQCKSIYSLVEAATVELESRSLSLGFSQTLPQANWVIISGQGAWASCAHWSLRTAG